MNTPRASSSPQAGFTLLEVLAALVLASLILVSLNMAMAAVGKGVDHTRRSLGEQSELGSVADVFTRDVARIAKIRRSTDPRNFSGYLFDGQPDAVIYPLREEEGLAAPGLYLVRLSLREDKGERQLVRERAPIIAGGERTLEPTWRDPVVLMSGDLDVTFAYRAQRSGRREWGESWQAAEAMPEQIRITVTDRATGRLRLPGLVQSLAIDTEVDCTGNRDAKCGGEAAGATQ